MVQSSPVESGTAASMQEQLILVVVVEVDGPNPGGQGALSGSWWIRYSSNKVQISIGKIL